jgi:hypothetical protein
MIVSLKYFRRKINFKKAFSIYNISQLGKYIPGSIWQFLARAKIYDQENVKKRTIKTSILFEIFLIIIGALFVGIILLLISRPKFIVELFYSGEQLVYYYLSGLIIVISSIYYFKREKINRNFLKLLSNRKLVIEIVIIQLLIWLSLGVSLYFILYPIDSSLSSIYVIGLFSFSYVIGFVFPFAPAGIGVRETILVLGLSPFADPSALVITVSFHRMLYLFVELLLVLFNYVDLSKYLRSKSVGS